MMAVVRGKMTFLAISFALSCLAMAPVHFLIRFAATMNEKSRVETGQEGFSVLETVAVIGGQLLVSAALITLVVMLVRSFYKKHVSLRYALLAGAALSLVTTVMFFAIDAWS
ncbi:hypothetical protein MO973_04330 [Paenibacillus sp. TRM 82003]|nr:hypothetical protein [Paenibacillus sp. TRM 82003]